ncbi:MAG: hypothetical protein KAG04_00335 [Mycoplasmataceae bacterium]|nr:hypothetical protein [Mycoplasmataceae bacterium]
MINAFIYISAGTTLAFIAIWTLMRFQRIAKKNNPDYFRKVFWVGLAIVVISYVGLLIAYLVQ